MEEKPSCPSCGKDEDVEAITGCMCMSCPPWLCRKCKIGPYPYEFWDDDGDDYQDDDEDV